jgi:hypothetical protein
LSDCYSGLLNLYDLVVRCANQQAQTLIIDQGEQRSLAAIGGSIMSMNFVRFTDGPKARVALGLCPAQSQEYATLENEQLEALSQGAQEHLARLVVADKPPITVQWYIPKIAQFTHGFFTDYYVRCDLPPNFAAPVPFTVELVVEWLEDLSRRCAVAELEAAEWHAAQVHAEQVHLQCADDDSCHFGLKALSEGKSYTVGPYGVTWALSTAATVRMDAIDRYRRQEVERVANEARIAAKCARRAFVDKVVSILGNESHKERLALNLLPMAEVGQLLQVSVFGSLHDRLCEDEDLESSTDPARLPAGSFEIFKLFKAAVDKADLTLIGEITIRPVVGYTNNRTQRHLLCEVRIADDPAQSDWSCEALYYLD